MSEYHEFYREIIQYHDAHPFHFAERSDADVKVEAYNPICGDHYHLYYDLSGSDHGEVSFHGYGCAISKASTSILVKYLSEHSFGEFEQLYKEYRNMLIRDLDQDWIEPPIEELEAFMGIRRNPSRFSCATLAWQALHDHLRKK